MMLLLGITALVAITVLSCMEDFGISFLVGAIACLLFFAGFDQTKNYISNHTSEVLFSALIYLTIGVVWSFFKWAKYISEEHGEDIVKKAKTQGISRAEVFESLKKTYPASFNPTRNVNKIVPWIVAWPFSMLCYALFDLLHDFVHSLIRLLSEVYNKSAVSFINLFLKDD